MAPRVSTRTSRNTAVTTGPFGCFVMFGLLVFVVGGLAGAAFLLIAQIAKWVFIALGLVLVFAFWQAWHESGS